MGYNLIAGRHFAAYSKIAGCNPVKSRRGPLAYDTVHNAIIIYLPYLKIPLGVPDGFDLVDVIELKARVEARVDSV